MDEVDGRRTGDRPELVAQRLAELHEVIETLRERSRYGPTLPQSSSCTS